MELPAFHKRIGPQTEKLPNLAPVPLQSRNDPAAIYCGRTHFVLPEVFSLKTSFGMF